MELEAISRIRYHSCRTAKDGAKVNAGYVGYEAAKWALLVRAFDWLQWIVQEHENRARTYCLSPMPDDGEWELTGYEIIDWKEPDFVGQHGYISHDINEVKKNWIFRSVQVLRRKLSGKNA